MAKLYLPSGEIVTVTSKNGRWVDLVSGGKRWIGKFTREELDQHVNDGETGYLERIRIGRNRWLYFHEEGRIRNLEPNVRATREFAPWIRHLLNGECLRGKVMCVNREEV